jgi:hypothetical protein
MKKEVKISFLVFLVSVVSFFILASSVFFVSGQSGSTNVNFSTGGITCERNTVPAAWFNYSSGVRTIVGNCSLYYQPGYIGPCCPSDQQCNVSKPINQGCYYWPVTRCDQYLDRVTCNADTQDVGEDSVGDPANCNTNSAVFTYNGNLTAYRGLRCTNSTSCECDWNGTSCLAVKAESMNCRNRSAPNGNAREDTGQCVYSVSLLQDNCNTTLNNIIIKSTATWIKIGPLENLERKAACQNITRTYPCVATAKLDFWTNMGLVIVILILVGFYIYLVMKRKKLKSIASARLLPKKKKK